MNQKTTKRLARQTFVVWASYIHSVWELSNELRALRVTHTIQPADRSSKRLIVDMKKAQPKRVHLVSNMSDLRADAINFIVASHSELSLMNIPLVPCGPDRDLNGGLRHCLLNQKETLIQVRAPSPVDYINMIAKPSLLNKIQTEILQISPYPFRKEVNADVIRFFNSQISERTLMRSLNRSLKLDKLKLLIKEGGELRAAIAMLDQMDAETISQKTGVPAFDISYFASAGRKLTEKTKADKAEK